MSTLQMTGYLAMAETITSGKPIDKFLNSIADTVYTKASDLYGGAIACLHAAFLNLRDSGVHIPKFTPDTDAFLQSSPNTMVAVLTHSLMQGTASDKITGMAATVNMYRNFITFHAPVVKAEAPKPIDVNVVNMPAPATTPTRVEVVSMPTRVKTSEIERDAHGNITDARQVERDAA